MIDKSTTKFIIPQKKGFYFLTKNKQFDENFALIRIFRIFQLILYLIRNH